MIEIQSEILTGALNRPRRHFDQDFDQDFGDSQKPDWTSLTSTKITHSSYYSLQTLKTKQSGRSCQMELKIFERICDQYVYDMADRDSFEERTRGHKNFGSWYVERSKLLPLYRATSSVWCEDPSWSVHDRLDIFNSFFLLMFAVALSQATHLILKRYPVG